MDGVEHTSIEGTYADPSGLAELRGGALRTLIVVSYAAALAVILISVLFPSIRRPELWLAVIPLAAAAYAAQKLANKLQILGSLVLIVGISSALLVASFVYVGSDLMYLFPVAAMVAVILLGLLPGLTTAALLSAMIFAIQTIDSRAPIWSGSDVTVVALIWSAAALCWLATRPTQVALEWSWQSYLRALDITEELRDRQGELGRLSKSLTEAYIKLEQINLVLDRARRIAEEARQAKAEFAATISHELRTPLNLIIGFSEMMVTARHTYSGESLPAGYRADVEAIYRNACHISNLIDDVLDLSRIEAHRMALHREAVAVTTIIDEAVATISSLIAELGLGLTIDVATDLPTVSVDRTRIRQIVINLLNNAIRSTDVGGITVKACRKDSDVVITVSDTGVGITADELPRLFEEFSMTGGSNRRGRSGLGLAVSKQFAELHGGTMWAESVRGKGSTFYVSLPLQERVVATAHESLPDALKHLSSEERPKIVAVIGEDFEAARVFQRYLDGYDVVVARRPDDLLKARRDGEGEPDAVVATDEDARIAWQEWTTSLPAKPTPTLCCTLSTSRSRAEALGVSDYLVKPVTRDQLRLALNKVPIPRRGLHRDVLIIEDDAEMTRLLVRMIRAISSRNHIRTASNGAEGLELAHRERPDIILLDMLMPTMDGYQVLSAVHEDEALRDVPVAIVTAKEAREEPVLASSISISRPGGMTVAEVMSCTKTALDCLLTSSVGDIDRAPPIAPHA